jgi:hypothetical protein
MARESPDRESPYGGRAIVTRIVRESPHGEIASVQRIASDSIATIETACDVPVCE